MNKNVRTMESLFHCTALLASCQSSYTTFVQLMVRPESILLFFGAIQILKLAHQLLFLALLLSPSPEGYCYLTDLQLGNLQRCLRDNAKGPIQKHFISLTVNVILI